MKCLSQLLVLGVVALAAISARAEEKEKPVPRDKPEKNAAAEVLRLPVLGHVPVGKPRLFTQCSPDMKYVSSYDAIQETATGNVITPLFPSNEQGFFSGNDVPRIIHANETRATTTICEFPGRKPVLVVHGRMPMWTAVWGRPLHEVPLLIAPVSEEEGRAEVWNLDSLTRLLDIHNKDFCADLVGPLQEYDWLVASQACNRLAWLNAEGDVYVWDLQARTSKPAIFSKIASARSESLCQTLFLSPDGARVAILEFTWSISKDVMADVNQEVSINLVQLSDGAITHIRWHVDHGSLHAILYVGLFFAPSGHEVVLTGARSPDSIFDVRTGKFLRNYQIPARSGDSKLVLSADLYARANENRCCFWRLPKYGACPTARQNWFDRSPQGVSPDGFYFIRGAMDAVIELASGRKITFAEGEGTKLKPLWLSPNGRYLLAFDDSRASPDDQSFRDLSLCELAANSPSDDKRAEAEWLSGLTSADATQAQIAVRRLARLGDAIVDPLLSRTRYETIPSKIEQFVKELDDNDYAVREAASRELKRVGGLAEEPLQRVVSESDSLEAVARAKRILGTIDKSTECGEVMAQLRALQILAIINSDRAYDGAKELRKFALSSRVRALADLTLFRMEFR